MEEEYKLILRDFIPYRGYDNYLERVEPYEERVSGAKILVTYNILFSASLIPFILMLAYYGLESLLR